MGIHHRRGTGSLQCTGPGVHTEGRCTVVLWSTVHTVGRCTVVLWSTVHTTVLQYSTGVYGSQAWERLITAGCLHTYNYTGSARLAVAGTAI